MSIGPSATFFSGGAPPASLAGRLAAILSVHQDLELGVYHASNVGVACARSNKRRETEVYKNLHVFLFRTENSKLE